MRPPGRRDAAARGLPAALPPAARSGAAAVPAGGGRPRSQAADLHEGGPPAAHDEAVVLADVAGPADRDRDRGPDAELASAELPLQVDRTRRRAVAGRLRPAALELSDLDAVDRERAARARAPSGDRRAERRAIDGERFHLRLPGGVAEGPLHRRGQTADRVRRGALR